MPKRRLPPTLLTLAGITLVAWFLAHATFSLREHPLDELSGTGSATAQTALTSETPADFAAITSRNLLNVRVTPPQSAAEKAVPTNTDSEPLSTADVDALPLSKKGWKLLGTIVTTNGQSRATILSDGKEQNYRQGERLQDWEIALVQRRTIVIAKGGVQERLVFADETPPTTEARPDLQKNVSKARLHQELGDISALMRIISVTPQSVGGYQGMHITSIQSGSYLEQLGLLQNDLLLEANGKKLAGFGDLAGLSELANTDAITLEVLRNGKKTIIRYDVQS